MSFLRFLILVTYFCKKFEKLRKYSLRTPKIKETFSLKKLDIKTKIGSNYDNLRNLEPQPKQRFLIKKKCIPEKMQISLSNSLKNFEELRGGGGGGHNILLVYFMF